MNILIDVLAGVGAVTILVVIAYVLIARIFERDER